MTLGQGIPNWEQIRYNTNGDAGRVEQTNFIAQHQGIMPSSGFSPTAILATQLGIDLVDSDTWTPMGDGDYEFSGPGLKILLAWVAEKAAKVERARLAMFMESEDDSTAWSSWFDEMDGKSEN